MSTDQDVIFTATARNIAQIINGRVSTDTDGNPTIYAEDYAAAAVDVLREARIPSGVDRAAVWDAAVAMLHNDVRTAIAAFNPDAEPTFPGEDFPEPACGEGARVAREEAAWEAQIKAAPLPAAAPALRWSVPEWVTRSYPVGSVWTIKRADGAAFGLITEGGADVRAVIKDHVVIARYGEPFVIRSHLLADVGGAPVAFDTGAFAWIAKRVDA
jgi:hypothetical protein